MTLAISPDNDRAAQLERLRQFLRPNILVALGVSVVIAGVGVVWHSAAAYWIALIPLVMAITYLWALRQVSHQQLERSIMVVCVGIGLIPIIGAIITPLVYPILTVVALWPVILALPYVTGRRLLLIIGWAALSAVITAILVRTVPGLDLSPIPPSVLIALASIISPPILGLLFLLLWQYSSRLNDNLTAARAANAALLESERTLEAKVQERTRRLELLAAENARLYETSERQKQYVEAVVQNSPVTIVTVDLAGNIVEWNPSAESLFQYSRAEAIGQNLDRLVPPNGGRVAGDGWNDAAVTQHLARTLTQRGRKDGSLVDVELLEVPVFVAGERVGYIAIYHDITELQQARQAAEVANQAKSGFLANMSHELRTPLNAIIGFTRIVRRKAEGVLPDKQVENLDKVLVSAEHLLRLINSVLDIAKIEAGRLDVQASAFEVAGLIDLCATIAQPLLKPGVALVKQVEPGLPLAQTDQDKVKQIVLNLLSNAAKFTHGGSIAFAARRQGPWLVIEVRDSGIGISDESLGRIFEEFQQADTSTTREYGGTGLGLSISRHLARLLGGDLIAASTLGEGSTFSLTVPFRYGQAAPEPLAEPTPEPVASDAGTGLGAARSGQRVVLAVDDDPDVVYLLQENLAEAGYQVVGVPNGAEAVQKARSLRPYAIMLDILMPQKDGWQVLYELKADPETKPIPVILLTVVDNKPMGYQMGAADYLLKPLNGEAVLAALRALAPAPVGDGSTPRRLLVVDDDPSVPDMVRQLLPAADYEVEAAPDGVAAVAAVARRRPDAILLDLMLPGLDGFGVIEHLRQDPLQRTIPIFVLTAKQLTNEEAAYLEQSAAQVIHKQGLEAEALIRELEQTLQNPR